MNYKQLTQAERYQIYQMNQMGMLQKDMALIVNVSASTICRELKRNTGKHGYYLKSAHQRTLQR